MIRRLRPIALLEPLSKSVMGALCYQLQRETLEALLCLPQMAYLCKRGCAEAILRVQNHCQQVRTLKFHHQYRIHQQAHGLQMSSLQGGLLISLDLTRAFDSVERSDMIRALQYFGVSSDLIAFVCHIYRDTSFSFEHKGHEQRFGTSRGIRQGCKSAPMLWALYVAWILCQYGELTTRQWMLTNNTVYADDWCLYDLFESMTDLQVILLRAGRLFDLLESRGLVVNNKTVAILHLQGNKITSALRRWVKRTSQGTFLVVPRQNGQEFHVRLVKQHCYLGIQLSYNNFELQTMQHRIRSANKISIQLQKWLTGRDGILLKHRIRVWFQCVFTCLIHGILQIGLTEQALQKMDVYCLKQLRRIAKDPVHVNRTPHTAFLRRFGLIDPLRELERRGIQTLAAWKARQAQLSPNDIVQTISVSTLQAGLEILQNYIATRRGLTPIAEVEKTYPCEHCDKFFLTQASLRDHCTKYHAHRSGQLRVFSYLNDAKGGLPTCSRCNTSFTRWKALIHHIEWVCHHDLPQDNQDLARFRSYQDDMHRLVQMDLSQIVSRPDICKHFSHHCVLCDKHEESHRCMTKHLQRDHPAEFAAHIPHHHAHTNQARRMRENPQQCPLCLQTIGQKHACMVVRQTAILLAHHSLAPSDRPTPRMVNAEGFSVFQYDQCDQTFHDETVLREHQVSHIADLAKFNALRDVTPDNFCRHCGMSYPSLHHVCLHILSNQCPVFDPNKQWTTLLDENSELEEYVRTGNIHAILQQPALLRVFDLQCALCCRCFKRKNDLQAHLKNIHSVYWKQVEGLVMKLCNHYQGSATNCYCTPRTKQWGKHQCSIFRQYALLRHVVYPELNNDTLFPQVMSSNSTITAPPGSTVPAPSRKYVNIMDCLRRSGAASPSDNMEVVELETPATHVDPYMVTSSNVDGTLIEDISSQDQMANEELAAHLERMIRVPQETTLPLLDKIQLSIVGQSAVHGTNAFMKLIYPALQSVAQPILQIALGEDMTLMTSLDMIQRLSTRCFICGHRIIAPERVWAHVYPHILQQHPTVSMYQLGRLLNEFWICARDMPRVMSMTLWFKQLRKSLPYEYSLCIVGSWRWTGKSCRHSS